MLKIFMFFILALTSQIVCSSDIESQDNNIKMLIKELKLDKDLENKLIDLSNRSIDELNYYEVPDILNEQQIRCSEAMSFIIYISKEQVISINLNDNNLLEAFYDKNKEKLKKAKYYWSWNRRGEALGFPPQWPVLLKICLFYGSYVAFGGIIYTCMNSNIHILI